MTLENKFLSQMGKDWEFQNYEWIVPENNDKGCMEAYKIETDCKLRKIESIVYYRNSGNFTISEPGASEASSKWVGTVKNYSTVSKKWVGKCPFSIKVKQKSGWARAHPAHPAPTPL